MESTLFKELEQQSANKSVEYAKLLEEAGLKKHPIGYPIITQDAIWKFLNKKACEIHKCDHVKEHSRNIWSVADGVELTLAYGEPFPKRSFFKVMIGYGYHTIMWNEWNLKGFKGSPPPHILKKIIDNKKNFDRIAIVTISQQREFDDPIIVGINEGDTNRYLIDWWDNDIDPSEIEMQ